MFNNPYLNSYSPSMNQQSFNERIDGEIAKLQQMKNNANQQQPAINQTFQLAPMNSHTMKYADTIDDVSKETVYFDTPFFSKDMSVVWIKNVKGEIKTYELNEIVPKDEKDLQIEFLKSKIEELEGMVKHDANVTNVNAKQDATNTTTNDRSIGATIKKNESSSIQKIPRGKKEQ